MGKDMPKGPGFVWEAQISFSSETMRNTHLLSRVMHDLIVYSPNGFPVPGFGRVWDKKVRCREAIGAIDVHIDDGGLAEFIFLWQVNQ